MLSLGVTRVLLEVSPGDHWVSLGVTREAMLVTWCH
jgi:hypothetical protein